MKTSKEPFDQLLTKARAGDRAALGAMLESGRLDLVRQARHRLPAVLQSKNAAADLVQETHLAALQNFGAFVGNGRPEFLAWLKRILRRKCADFSRAFCDSGKRAVSRESSLTGSSAGDKEQLREVMMADTPSAEAQINEEELSKSLRRLLGKLPVNEKVAVVSRYWQNWSLARIAARLHCSQAQIRHLLRRARKTLEKRCPHVRRHSAI